MALRDDAEWKRFLADSWERGEPPTDDAWRRHVRRAAFEHLRQAQKLLDHLIEPDDDSVEGYEQAADEVLAMANRYLRLPPVPHVPPEAWESDEGISAAWAAREHELKVMPYGEYLRTPEWAEQRCRALRRADGRCETCARTQRLHVHHRKYSERGRERVGDLIVLCDDCHLAVHTSGGSHRIHG